MKAPANGTSTIATSAKVNLSIIKSICISGFTARFDPYWGALNDWSPADQLLNGKWANDNGTSAPVDM
jgi:hypothetical protein